MPLFMTRARREWMVSVDFFYRGEKKTGKFIHRTKRMDEVQIS